jgi:hypothetical protein
MSHNGTGCINEQHPALVGLIRVAEEDMSLLFILSHLSAARMRMSPQDDLCEATFEGCEAGGKKARRAHTPL